MQRRAFLKLLGGAFAGSALAAAGCATREDDTGRKPIKGAQPTDKMTYRIDPKTGQKVSLLGYGCMRWPTVSDSSAPDGDRIDQEAVNRLVDYAITHGVNLFDTSPRYCKGRSEEALGRALSLYPRESYLLSTKMSNQGDSSREGSLKIWKIPLKISGPIILITILCMRLGIWRPLKRVIWIMVFWILCGNSAKRV